MVEFTPRGDYVRHWGKKGTGDGEFDLVHDVAVDSRGRVYVGDRLNERIQVFDENGKFLAKWTDIGSPWGLYYAPKEEAIYMCDGRTTASSSSTWKARCWESSAHMARRPANWTTLTASRSIPDDGSLYTVEIKNWRVQKWV